MRRASLPALGALLLLAGCNRVQSALDPAADQSRSIHGMLLLMLWVCGIMYLLVLAFLAWALWRARGKLGRLAVGDAEAETDDRGIERAMGGWTVLVVAGLLLLITGSFLVDRSLAKAGPEPIRVKVTAQQWWWNVEYEDPDPSQRVTTANELHLPVNRPAEITLESTDVIHSFWVPSLHGKEDLIPGRTNQIQITPRRVGDYRGQCAEFCGLQHANMAIDVVVDTPVGFDAWKVRQRREAPPPMTAEQQRGQQIVVSGACSLCHTVQGTTAAGRTGPDLTHVASRKTIAAGALPYSKAALAGWIADPQGVKPGANMPIVGLKPADLQAVVAYLDTLK